MGRCHSDLGYQENHGRSRDERGCVQRYHGTGRTAPLLSLKGCNGKITVGISAGCEDEKCVCTITERNHLLLYRITELAKAANPGLLVYFEEYININSTGKHFLLQSWQLKAINPDLLVHC